MVLLGLLVDVPSVILTCTPSPVLPNETPSEVVASVPVSSVPMKLSEIVVPVTVPLKRIPSPWLAEITLPGPESPLGLKTVEPPIVLPVELEILIPLPPWSPGHFPRVRLPSQSG